MSPPSLLRHADFLKLWSAQTISAFGARITREGLPMVAVLTLSASPGQLGVLAALTYGPALVVGLAAGGLIDRGRRRRVLIGADLVRAATLVTLPAAAWLGVLDLWQVYTVAATVGAASVVFDIADHAYLPSLISREALTEGNARLSATDNVAEVGGPALAGALFQWLTAPIAILVNAFSYLASALLLASIAQREPKPEPRPPAPWRQDVIDGFQALWSEPRLRPLIFMTTNNFFGAFFGALYTLYALRTLGLTPALLGITVAAGGLGGLVGATLVGPLSRALGVGPAMLAGALGWALATLAIPLAPADPVLGTLVLCAAQFAGDLLATAGLILATTLRQSLLREAVLGRVAATYQAMIGGAAILGALTGGVLGGAIGPRAALAISALGLLIAPVIGFFSPLRQVREMPQAPT